MLKVSFWYMFSVVIYMVSKFLGDIGDIFVGVWFDGVCNKVCNGSLSNGVWFDFFGKGFVNFGLRGMFVWLLMVLVVMFLILVLVMYIFYKLDKYYFFILSVRMYD